MNMPPGTNVLWSGGGAPPTVQRPQLAMALGVFVAEWSTVEMMMAHLFATLIHIDGRVSTGILDRVLSTQQKIAILKFTTQQTVPDEHARTPVMAALGSVQRLSSKRNDLVHGKWGISEAYPEHLIWTKNTFEPDVPHLMYNAPDFERLIGKVVTVRNDLHVAIMALAFPGLRPNAP